MRMPDPMNTRIDLYLPKETKDLIERAASIKGTSASAFIIGYAKRAATRVVTEYEERTEREDRQRRFMDSVGAMPMSSDPNLIPVPEPLDHLIIKGGYYYRPNRSGYTKSRLAAGLYTKSAAEREALIEPWHMRAVRFDDPISEEVVEPPLRKAAEGSVAERLIAEIKSASYTLGYRAGLEAAAKLAADWCLVPPDGGSPTLTEAEWSEQCAAAIRALKEKAHD